MANSLHFIQHQHLLLSKLLLVTNRYLIVEYERSKPSPWVPHPIGFERLSAFQENMGVRGHVR
jgi:hypothetical protein